MDGKVLGVERRRRWSKDEKARIVEETLMPGAVVSEIARRHGMAQSLLFTWRRLARTVEPAGRDGSIVTVRRRPDGYSVSGACGGNQAFAGIFATQTKQAVIALQSAARPPDVALLRTHITLQ